MMGWRKNRRLAAFEDDIIAIADARRAEEVAGQESFKEDARQSARLTASLAARRHERRTILRRPGSIRVGAACQVAMPGEGWLAGHVAGIYPDGVVEVRLENNGRIAVGMMDDPCFKLR
jgi:hypothetical protein